MHRTQNTAEGISFEDSLVTGTKIDIPKKNKNLQKKLNEVQHKKQKIDEIQKKYDKKTSAAPVYKKKVTRGYSYQEHDKIVKNKMGVKSQDTTPKQKSGTLGQVGINASKVTTHKRDAFKDKKHSEAGQQKVVFESRRKIEDEQTDEKLRTQTFRFTNQFKSEDGDGTYFNENDEDEIYDEFIEEEIDAESHRTPPKAVKKMELVRDAGPQEIPSDTNPFTKKRENIEVVNELMGTPNSKPPKVPPRVNMNNVFKSPANNIFKQSKPNSKHEDLLLDKRKSEPPKPLNNVFANIEERKEVKITDEGIIGYEFSNEDETIAKESQLHQKSIAELALQKMRSDYTQNALMNRPYSPPFIS